MMMLLRRAKKTFCVFCCLLLAGAAFAGCGGDASSAGAASSASLPQGSAPAPLPAQKETLPAPALTEVTAYLLAEGEEYFAEYGDRKTRLPIPASEGGEAGCFASEEEVLAAVWGDLEHTVAVSRDGGQNWVQATLPALIYKTRVKTIGFTTPELGWVALGSLPSGAQQEVLNNEIYLTQDGGNSWQHLGSVPFSGALSSAVFPSALHGFVGFYDGAATEPMLYETEDGGQSWAPVEISFLPEMLVGMRDMQASVPAWQGGQWAIRTLVRRPAGYIGGFAFYSFVREPSGQWVWNDPGWPVPEGTSEVQLIDYLKEADFPSRHSATAGLNAEGISSFWLVCDALGFMERRGITPQTAEGGFAVVPAAEVAKMVEYQFGDAHFDVALLPDYDAELDGFLHDSGHAHEGKGGFGRDQEVRSISLNSEGNIEAILDVYSYVTETSRQWESALQLVLRPAVVEGVPFFTLLNSQPADKLAES